MASKDSLSDVNHRFVAKGETLPAVTLPDGSKVQTGTVGALIQNIKVYDRVSAGERIEGPCNSNWQVLIRLTIKLGLSKSDIEGMMELAIPTLARIGFFDLFPVKEWMASNSEGRKFVGKRSEEMGY